MNFPRIIYHETEDPRPVYGQAEASQLLDAGWRFTPDFAPPEPAPVPDLAARVDALEAKVTALENARKGRR